MKKASLNMASALIAGLLLSGCHSPRNFEVRPVEDPHLSMPAYQTPSPYQAGKAYLAQKDYGRAIDEFRKSVALGDRPIEALNGLAITYDMMDRFDISQSYYRKALTIDPLSPVTLANMALSMERQGNTAEADRLRQLARQDEAAPFKETPASENIVTTGALPLQKPVAVKTIKETRTEISPVTANAKHTVLSSASQPASYRVLNGTGRLFMATRVASFIEDRHLTIEKVANAESFDYKTSVIRFAEGRQEDAAKIASLLPVPVVTITAGDIETVDLVLGQDFLPFDTTLMGSFTQNYNL